jgi:CheY-like chemotaxis protein
MAGGAGRTPVDVLLIEDDRGEAMMITEAFEQSTTPVRLHIAGDGVQAMRFLRRGHGFADAPRPGLILLDLNLPLRTGLDVLTEVKTDDDLLAIPVVVLTSSQADDDVRLSYSRHANAFITKPPDFDGFTEVIRQIAGCFLDLIQLPPPR